MTTAPIAPIGAEDLLEIIKQDAFRLRYAWMNFRFLFAGEKKHVEILNAAGPGFFGMAQRMMFDDVILRICRLTDPAANRNQENTTLKRLLQATDWQTSDPAKHAVFSAKIAAVDAACDGCRQHRNKRISHADLLHSQKALSLPDATMKMIDSAVDAIEGFIRDINYELHPDVEQSFEIIDGDRDVKHLIHYLENRTSQKQPDAISTITHEGGNRAEFRCAFCGETSSIAFYPNGVPTPRMMVRWHFDKCHGVVGHETIAVEIIDSRGVQQPARLAVDLRVPTRETDA
jgi:hypothetical protein